MFLVLDDAFVVRAGKLPISPFLETESGIEMHLSADNRPSYKAAELGSRAVDFQGRDIYPIWELLKKFADVVDDAAFYYDLTNTDYGNNSNAFIRTALYLVDASAETSIPLPSNGVKWYSGSQYLTFNYTLSGEESADRMYGLGGSQTFFGFGGNDTLRGGSDADSLNGGAGSDILYGDTGSDALRGGIESDTLYGGADVDYLAGEAGADLLVGGGGGDRYSVGVSPDPDVIDDQGGGDDVIAFSSGSIGAINFNWFSRSGNDLVIQVPGGGGQLALNLLVKNMGADSGAIETFDLLPDSGNFVSQSWDLKNVWTQLVEPSAPSKPTFATITSSPVPVVPSSGSFTWSGTGNSDAFVGGSGHDVIRGLDGNDALGGGSGNDSLLGNKGADVINGADGDDLLIDDDDGSLGDDFLDGGAGNDSLVFYGAPRNGTDEGDGGSGNDLALVDLRSRTQDWRVSTSGSDIDVRPNSSTVEGNVHLKNIETVAVLFGSGNDDARGGDETDYFEGGAGNDDLSGGRGNDYLDGGSGDDRLEGGLGTDYLDGGAGNDHAKLDLSDESRATTFIADEAASSGGFTLVDGTHVKNAESFELDTGSRDDQVWLGRGKDTVRTGAGSDTITTRGEAADFIDGGSGTDRLVVDYSSSFTQIKSSYSQSSGDYQIWIGTQYASATDKVRAVGVEEFVISGGTANDNLRGGAGDDVLRGNAGSDNLDALGGNNALYGGAGDDNLSVGDGRDFVDGGEGFDKVSIMRLSATTDIVYREKDAATEAGVSLYGGASIRNVEAVDLWSGSGNDFVSLSGRASSFLHLGGGQNGVEIDYSWTSQTITAEVKSDPQEYSISTATGETVQAFFLSYISVIGGRASDKLTGRDNANSSKGDTLRGGAGDDTINGLAGNDYLRGDDGSDQISGGAGFDDINGNVGNDTGWGGEGSDWVVGGKDQDLLYGENGDDVVYGNLGNDTCDGGSGVDWVRGGQGDDSLSGGDGNDWLSGDRGSDTISGGAGADVFHTFADAGVDRVLDFSRAQGDRVQVDPGTTWLMSQVGSDVVIDMTGGGQMVLVGIQASSLSDGWIFVG